MGEGGGGDGSVHPRCGKPWADHRIVVVDGWLPVPTCDDEEAPGEGYDGGK